MGCRVRDAAPLSPPCDRILPALPSCADIRSANSSHAGRPDPGGIWIMPDDGRPALPDIDCIRGFAGASPMAVAVLQGPAHRIRYVNPAFLAATGRAEQALLNCRMAEAFPELGEAPLAALDRVHGTGEPCRAEAIALAL